MTAAVLVVGSLTLAACGSDDAPSRDTAPPPTAPFTTEAPAPAASTPSAVSPTSQPGTYVRQTPAADCGNGYPVPLTVEAESVAEIASLSLISACGTEAGDAMFLANRSELVWRIYADAAAGAVSTTHSARTPAQEILQQVAGQASIMEPGSGIEIPAAPAYVHWYADPALTAVLAATVQVQEKVIETAIDKSPNVLREGSRARAHYTCALTGYQTANAALKTYGADSDEKRTEAVADGVESVFSSAGECRTALQSADDEQLATQKISRRALPELDASPRTTRVQTIARPVRSSWRFHSRT